MLTSITLDNWKSFKHASLHIDPLTVIIGTNASGKSNALDAIAFLNRIATGTMLTSALKGDSALTAIRGGLEWAARKPENEFSLSATIRTDISTDYEYRLECRVADNKCDLISEQLSRVKYSNRKGKVRGAETGRIKLFRTDVCSIDSPTIVARLYNEKQGTPRPLGRAHAVLFQLAGQTLRQEIQDGINTTIESLRNIFILDPIPSHMRNFSPLAEKLHNDASNIAGVIAALPDTKKPTVEKTLSKYVKNLPEKDIHRVYAETVGKFKSDAMLYCEENWQSESSPTTVDARGMSDGTLRFLAILTALLTRPEGTLLVVEEIDNGLHPSRAKLLLEVLQTIGGERRVDVLVTTHNPALLDAMGMAMVPFIVVAHRDASEGYSRLTLLEDIKQLPKLLAQGPIGKLSSMGWIEQQLFSSDDLAAE